MTQHEQNDVIYTQRENNLQKENVLVMCGCDSFPVCGGAGLAPVYNAQPEWPYRTEGVKASSGFWGWSVVAVLALACRRGGGLLGV